MNAPTVLSGGTASTSRNPEVTVRACPWWAGGTLSWPGLLLPLLTGGYSVALVLDELLDEAPVTWFRS